MIWFRFVASHGEQRPLPSMVLQNGGYPNGGRHDTRNVQPTAPHEPPSRDDAGAMKNDDYLNGPHYFWIHFWCGLFFGSGLGAFVGWGLFSGWAAIATFGCIALAAAYSCGRWGDPIWHALIRIFFPR